MRPTSLTKRFNFVTKRPRFFDDLGQWAEKSKWRLYLFEFVLFGMKQAWAALFGGLLLAAILLSRYWYPGSSFLYRYDFLFLYALLIQAALIFFKLETIQEAKVILLFFFSWHNATLGLFFCGPVGLF